MKKPTKAQAETLILIRSLERLESSDMMIYKIQRRVLLALEKQGYIRYVPYGKPKPYWRVND